MKLEWEDATSYARGEHGKCEPRVWALRFSGGNLLVHRKIHQDGWFYTLRNLWIEDEPLDNVDIESAKKEAVGSSGTTTAVASVGSVRIS